MKLEGYTPELFAENYIKDCEVFGEETTQAIYEEIFSAVCGKKVKLDSFTEALNKSLKKIGGTEIFLETTAYDIRKAKAMSDYQRRYEFSRTLRNSQREYNRTHPVPFAQANYIGHKKNIIAGPGFPNKYMSNDAIETLNNELEQAPQEAIEKIAEIGAAEINAGTNEAAAEIAGEVAGEVANGTADTAQAVANAQIIKTGFLSKIGKFITSLPTKVKTFFGSLQGKSFGEIMKQGMSWLAANPALALKTTGGIALVALLIRALKKKGQLRDYANLARIEARARTLKEDCYDAYEDTKEKEAMRKILEECKTNKRLAEVILG